MTQRDEGGHQYVVAYASRSNRSMESKYSSYEGEALEVVWAIPHLYGQWFTLVIDHHYLKRLMESDKLVEKVSEWTL